MAKSDSREAGFEVWVRALEARHLANLTVSELTRALRALSSAYVERRSRLARGAALDTAGKRAAFALYYAPLHFLVTREIVRALGAAEDPVARVVDLGCGTGAAGAAWVLEAGRHPSLLGVDRHPWAVREADWTYRTLALHGRATHGDLVRVPFSGSKSAGVAAFVVNELSDTARRAALERLLAAARRRHRVLVIEPVAGFVAPWWDEWRVAFERAGGRADIWRFAVDLPDRLRQLDRAAGLDHRELTGRSLWIAKPGENPHDLS